VRIDILLFNGFDELDAIGPFEVLKNAADAGADITLRFVAPTPGEIVADHGLRVVVAAGLGDGPRPDVVVVPGGGWIDRNPQGARAEAERGEVPAWLADLHRGGTVVATVCTGAMLAAAAGLLSGKPATTNHGALDDLRAAGAEVVPARVVDAGAVVTAGGVTSGLDLALYLIERFFGPAAACRVERQMEYERRGTVWRRPG
jgi:transcriptional regulator GlxA family with amidase domain